MSWEFDSKLPSDIKVWLTEQLSGPNSTVLAMHVEEKEAYAAVEDRRSDGTSRVVGVVALMKLSNKQADHFYYRIMPEDVGPIADSCPKQILDLLTPTDDEFALDWRRRCESRHQHPGTNLRLGDIIRLEKAIVVRRNEPQDTFKVVELGTVGRQDLFEALSTETGEPLFTCRIPKYLRPSAIRITEAEVVKDAEVADPGPRM